jgi:hypothetical protein
MTTLIVSAQRWFLDSTAFGEVVDRRRKSQ